MKTAPIRISILLLVAVACGQSRSGGAGTFQLAINGEKAPVAVAMVVPGWAEAATSKPDAPVWKLEGARLLSLVAIAPSGDDAATRMKKAIRMQYGDEGGADRTDLPDGRVWVARAEGENLHARMFVPFDRGVVMGVAILADEGKARLPEIKQAFETIKIAAP